MRRGPGLEAATQARRPERNGRREPPEAATNLAFQRAYTPAFHERMVNELLAAAPGMPPFAYTFATQPPFLNQRIAHRVLSAAMDIVGQVTSDAYCAKSRAYVPATFRVPHVPAKPDLVLVDFALARDAKGHLVPKLIELQSAAPQLAMFYTQGKIIQRLLEQTPGMPAAARFTHSGMSPEDYRALLSRRFLDGHAPEHVVLMDIDPFDYQHFPHDFILHKELFGIDTVDIRDIYRVGDQLFRRDADGREVQVKRIVNRMLLSDPRAPHDHFATLFDGNPEVSWFCDPEWHYRVAKPAMFDLVHESVPRILRLSDVKTLPEDLVDWVLKPLADFGGEGVTVGPTVEDIAKIREHRDHWCLQERVRFAPWIPPVAGEGNTQCELRVVCIRDGEQYVPAVMWSRQMRGGGKANVYSNIAPGTGPTIPFVV